MSGLLNDRLFEWAFSPWRTTGRETLQESCRLTPTRSALDAVAWGAHRVVGAHYGLGVHCVVGAQCGFDKLSVTKSARLPSARPCKTSTRALRRRLGVLPR